MLEQKIELLTAAVEALTKAIGGTLPFAVKDPSSGHGLPETILSAEPFSCEVHEFDPDKMTSRITEKTIEVKVAVPNGKSQTTSDTSQSSAPESEPVTYDDVKRATNAVSKISRDKAIAGLARFGVESATKLAEAQWPEYAAYMMRVAAGEVDPEASHE